MATRIWLVASLVMAVGGSAASAARAATVTVGSPISDPSLLGAGACSPSCTFANTMLGEAGAKVTSPISGTIVRWRLTFPSGAIPDPFALRVLRPAGGGQYTGAGTSSRGTPVAGTQTVFPASLPIQAGDLIGLDVYFVTSGQYPVANDSGSTWLEWAPAFADGSLSGSPSLGPTPNQEIAFNADVQPPPGISSLSPASGSIRGGTTVTITGHDFTGATAVAFGSRAAPSFTVNSDTQITAVSPPGSAPGPADVRVTTPAGVTPVVGADRFAYTACVVPRLKGKRLKVDKRRLRRDDCRLGKVRGEGSRVRRQRPKPGTVLPPGSKVNVKLG